MEKPNPRRVVVVVKKVPKKPEEKPAPSPPATPPRPQRPEGWFARLAKEDPAEIYLLKQQEAHAPLLFVCYAGKIEAEIERIEKYQLALTGQVEPLNKTEILYLYKPDVAREVEKLVTVDEELAGRKLPALYKRTERLRIPGPTLLRCHRDRKRIRVKMRNGHVLTGEIYSFGIFSIRLSITPNTRVTVMRHAVYELGVASE